jgi:hypothetical protein
MHRSGLSFSGHFVPRLSTATTRGRGRREGESTRAAFQSLPAAAGAKATRTDHRRITGARWTGPECRRLRGTPALSTATATVETTSGGTGGGFPDQNSEQSDSFFLKKKSPKKERSEQRKIPAKRYSNSTPMDAHLSSVVRNRRHWQNKFLKPRGIGFADQWPFTQKRPNGSKGARQGQGRRVSRSGVFVSSKIQWLLQWGAGGPPRWPSVVFIRLVCEFVIAGLQWIWESLLLTRNDIKKIVPVAVKCHRDCWHRG